MLESQDTKPDPLQLLRAAIRSAAQELRADAARIGTDATLERSPKPEFGDYATNAALLLAPALGEPPRAIAERLGGVLGQALGDQLTRAEVAGPGFVNLFLADVWYRQALAGLLVAGERLAPAIVERPQRILIEFVSANPTGPLTAASGRHAAYGDALARILEHAGHAVQREYYLNDAGSQVAKLGESIRARARGEEIPEDGYAGDYVGELAQAIPDAAAGDPDELAGEGVRLLIDDIRATLERFRVHFDSWFSERSLYAGTPSAVQRAYRLLERAGHVYESEGALWLRTTAFGDDKDRVLRRSNGEDTYFAADIAYHHDKRQRGFERLIDVWGADHHGYRDRMRAAFAALGGDPDDLELLIMQFVHVVEGGARASMSKRRGEFVTLAELIDEIGVDAARYFLLQRSHDSTVDLDLDLARRQSNENPVYYVQYAHARIVSILARVGDRRVGEALEAVGAAGGGNGTALAALDPAERALIRRLLAFGAEALPEAVTRRAPHRIANYALELAQDFTAFYRDCRVLDVEPRELESFRIVLCAVTKRALARSLDLLGVAAPDAM